MGRSLDPKRPSRMKSTAAKTDNLDLNFHVVQSQHTNFCIALGYPWLSGVRHNRRCGAARSTAATAMLLKWGRWCDRMFLRAHRHLAALWIVSLHELMICTGEFSSNAVCLKWTIYSRSFLWAQQVWAPHLKSRLRSTPRVSCIGTSPDQINKSFAAPRATQNRQRILAESTNTSTRYTTHFNREWRAIWISCLSTGQFFGSKNSNSCS